MKDKKYNFRKEAIEVKDINDDFSKEISERKRIIILVEHSKSYEKEYAFKSYIDKRFDSRGDKYVIAIAYKDFITPENLNLSNVMEILNKDLNNVYDEFKERYPEAKLEKPFSFNYAIDYSEKTQIGEIMTVALMRVSQEYVRTQISPIVKLTKKQYEMLIGKDESYEGKLLNEILTEKRMGIEQYGLIGYLTNGKFKTHNMYMEGLLDLLPEYRNEEKFRPDVLEYKNYRTSQNSYLFSIKTEEEKKIYIESENESIV